MTQLKINPNEWYTLNDIFKTKMLYPWAVSFWKIRKIVVEDREGKNLLNASIEKEGVSKRYLFKGKNIIKLIKKLEGVNTQPKKQICKKK